MRHYTQHFIDGEWVDARRGRTIELINPATEQAFATLRLGSESDVKRAVDAARKAFSSFSQSSISERIALFERMIAAYTKHQDALQLAIAEEVGCPVSASIQVTGALDHFRQAITTLRTYDFERSMGVTLIRREPIGVAGLISPWNWPIQTPCVKLASAFAAGCTVVLKPSEYSSSSAVLLANVLAEAKIPPGVFNLVLGDGPGVGHSLCAHPEVDMISFTGSTRSGILVAQAAAASVKRVAQELGGKSANIVMTDADLEAAARWNVARGYFNTGQSCHAPSRILVHRDHEERLLGHLAREAANIRIGNPLDPAVTMGPVVNEVQFERVQTYIRVGLEEGARLVCGGVGRPDNLQRGFYVKPTIFAGVAPHQRIAQEEIFGPVLTVLTYATEDEAVDIANGTKFGLAGYVFASTPANGKTIANRLQAGRVFINGAPANTASPMGGYKQSGNGREMGVFGLEEFLETKAIFGASP